jgi:hypothetical protein
MKYAIDTTFAAALLAIVLGTVSGVLVTIFPSNVYPWIGAVVGGIAAIAALIRKQFNVPEGE